MDDRVVAFLRSEATRNGFTVHNAFVGEIDLNHDAPIRQSCGAVYGIWADTSVEPAPPGVSILPDDPYWFPVYWGKDIRPCSRILAHVQKHKRTGNIDLRSITEIRGRRILFGIILVSGYERFEHYLHNKFKPFKGSGRPGKKSKLIRIEK